MTNKPSDKELEVMENIIITHIKYSDKKLSHEELGSVIKSVRDSMFGTTSTPLLIENNSKPEINQNLNQKPKPKTFYRKPAVEISKSITPTHLICLECGGEFKSLKRHLRVYYDLTPAEYRKKWNLPSDYPITSPSYSELRRRTAKKMRLGKR